MPGLAIPPADPVLDRVLAEEGFGSALFTDRRYRCVALVDRFGLELAIDVAGRLGLPELLAGPTDVAGLLAARGLVPRFAPALAWVLERLAAAGLVAAAGAPGDRRYALARELPPPRADVVRREVLRLDPAVAPTLDLLQAAAEAYPRVARGEIDGPMFLFSRFRLWQAFLTDANWYYGLTNRVAAHAAAERLPQGGVQALEVGAGLGSGTAALLEALAARGTPDALASFTVTEPAALFRKHLQRSLDERFPDQPITVGVLDVDRSWESQGQGPESLDLVWGVNVFHLARDLDFALAQAHSVLRPGGWLVLGEGIRPSPHHHVTVELVFQLLPAFVDVRTHPAERSSHGFLTPAEWRQALERAGFTEIRLVPDLFRITAATPLFNFGAVCGRRPAVGEAGARARDER